MPSLSKMDCAKAILKEHGDTCNTYKTAKAYMDALEGELGGQSAEEDREVSERLYDRFLRDLLDDYAHILQEESEYRLSDESVDENIQANEYEFDKNGNRI